MENDYLKKVKLYYKENENYYHTIHHVENLFKKYEEFQDEFEKEFSLTEDDKAILFYAIAYHDSFYIPGYKYNEEISAEIARQDLKTIVNSYSLYKIVNAIKSTSLKFPLDLTTVKFEEIILHDLDWSRFLNYEDIIKDDEKVLNEAVDALKCDEQEVIKNQIKFYEKFRNKKIYHSKTFSKFNKIVKENMNKRYQELKEMKG